MVDRGYHRSCEWPSEAVHLHQCAVVCAEMAIADGILDVSFGQIRIDVPEAYRKLCIFETCRLLWILNFHEAKRIVAIFLELGRFDWKILLFPTNSNSKLGSQHVYRCHICLARLMLHKFKYLKLLMNVSRKRLDTRLNQDSKVLHLQTCSLEFLLRLKCMVDEPMWANRLTGHDLCEQ